MRDQDTLTLIPRPPAHGDAPLLIGYSGGLDSTALLHLFATDPSLRRQGLRAIHIDHG
ncbi:MAG: hypothetical protein E6Q88_10990, partial [Lysobacteraceae bacterium]